MTNINLKALEGESVAVIRFFKKQLDSFGYIKKEIERVQWSDIKYDELVDCMNEIGSVLSEIFQVITNGTDVYVISELVLLAQKYLENENKFPII